MSDVCEAQPVNKAVGNAYIITRMAEKFHVQPRPVNDTFSNDLFNRFLNDLDEERIYFNREDLARLSAYSLQLDDQVKQKKTDFLKVLIPIYQKRLQQADSLIDVISKTRLNFTLAEKLSVAEDSSYPSDLSSMYTKLYKKIKLDVLEDLLDLNDGTSPKNPARKKQILDSAQTVLQKKTESVYKRNIKRILQSPGGVDEFIGTSFCKALAVCYDPHTEYLPLTEEENFESELGKQRFRFGFAIKEDENGGVIINDLQPGSPAFKCGLLNKGDKFINLQWEGQSAIDVSDANTDELGEILSQSNHDKLAITVKKPDGTLRTVSLMKEEGEADEDNRVKSFVLRGTKTVGYISLPAFYHNWDEDQEGDNGCANDVAKEIVKLKKENIQGLILDLRYNGGGSVREAVQLAGIFIDAGPVAQEKNRLDAKVSTLKDINRGTIYDGPLLLLVNGYSASASELVAGMLQDYNRALIVGSTTYGKATAQFVLPLDTNVNMEKYNASRQADAYLKITMSKLYRVNGTTAQFTGVKPDVELPDFLQADPQRESNEDFALQPTSIDPNKYYQPYHPIGVSALQAIAKNEVDTIVFFKYLEAYVRQYKLLNTPKDVSLKWTDALEKEKEDTLPTDFHTTDYSKTTYSIQNNSYELQRLQTDAGLKGSNDIFIGYLSRDPYLKISYDLVSYMSK